MVMNRGAEERSRGRRSTGVCATGMKSAGNERVTTGETRRSPTRMAVNRKGVGSETIILPHNRAPDELASREIAPSSAQLITSTCGCYAVH